MTLLKAALTILSAPILASTSSGHRHPPQSQPYAPGCAQEGLSPWLAKVSFPHPPLCPWHGQSSCSRDIHKASMWAQDKNRSCIPIFDSLAEWKHTNICPVPDAKKKRVLDLEKGVLLCLFPIFQEMLLCLLSTLSRNWAFDRCIKTRDTGAAEPYPLTMPHAQRETGSTMQFAEISDNWRHTGKWVAMTPGLWPDCCRGDTQSTAVPGLSDLRSQWS